MSCINQPYINELFPALLSLIFRMVVSMLVLNYATGSTLNVPLRDCICNRLDTIACAQFLLNISYMKIHGVRGHV